MIKVAVVGLAGIYIFWGVIHHWQRGDLHIKIVLEYLGIAILGVALVFSLLTTI